MEKTNGIIKTEECLNEIDERFTEYERLLKEHQSFLVLEKRKRRSDMLAQTLGVQAANIYYYLCGACFSIEGHVKKISSNICMFTGKETMIIAIESVKNREK